MSEASMSMQVLGAQARDAAKQMRTVATRAKNRALELASTVLRRETGEIVAANALDMKAAAAAGLDAAMQDRLRLDADRIEAMAEGLEQVAGYVQHAPRRNIGFAGLDPMAPGCPGQR